MSNTQIEQLTAEQNDRVNALVSNATKNYAQKLKAKGTEVTQEGIVSFVEKIIPGIIASVKKSSSANDKAKRASDLKAVNELAALHGIKFVHRRDREEEVVDSITTHMWDYGYAEHNRIEYVNATRGGHTIAFKYVLDDRNNLFIEYATAFCRPDENFDPLIGKQEALKKFLGGEVVATQITHEPFGPVKLDQLVSVYKTFENERTELRKQFKEGAAKFMAEATQVI